MLDLKQTAYKVELWPQGERCAGLVMPGLRFSSVLAHLEDTKNHAVICIIGFS